MSAKRKRRFTRISASLLRHSKRLLVGATGLLLLLVAILVITTLVGRWQVNHKQNALQPFYNTNGLSSDGPMGQVVRHEPLAVSLPHGTAERVLYRTQKGDGSVTFSSGMVFIPNNNNAGSPRPVVAWAHGTVGMGDQCAPSRIDKPIGNIDWVDEMLARGWVVTATDYAGLGTPGVENYLVGNDEAHDVLNSVRAARDLPAAQAGSTFAVWGHSQGGNSALFSAAQAADYAPELKLAGTVASAPAAELVALFGETGGTIDWVIGPEVLVSWPNAYANLDAKDITTTAGYKSYQKIADSCIAPATLGALVRNSFGQHFFSTNPVDSPDWRAVTQAQGAPVLNPSQPLLVAESLQDKVVLPNTTALYIQRACQAGSNLTSLWLADVGHIQLSSTIAPEVISWINDRFDARPTAPTCNQPLPITPATIPGS